MTILHPVDAAELPATQSRRARGDAVEDRVGIRRRAADDAQDLSRRRLLLERFAQLSGTGVDLLLEGGVRLLELRRRPIELVGQCLELVARPDLDAVAELARPDAGGARLERLDRLDHAPRQERAREHGERHAEQDEHRRAENGRANPLEGLDERLLHEHQPAKRGMGAKAVRTCRP